MKEQEEEQEATGTPSRGSMPPFCGRDTNLVSTKGKAGGCDVRKKKGRKRREEEEELVLLVSRMEM